MFSEALSYRLTRLVTWMMFETFPRGGEGWLVVRTGSSIVTDTPDFCWLMERRTRLSLGVTEGKRKAGMTDTVWPMDDVCTRWLTETVTLLSEEVYLLLCLHRGSQTPASLRLPQKDCSSFCLWKSCVVFPSPFFSPPVPPLHSSGHFPGCHLGQSRKEKQGYEL